MCSEVVGLVGGNGVDPTMHGRGISEIAVVELHTSLVNVMRGDVYMIVPLGVEG